MPPRNPEVRPCACCGRVARIHARGWISACYTRWVRAGRPGDGPLPPTPRDDEQWRRARLRGVEAIAAQAAVRVEDYADMTRTLGFSPAEAARALGVCERTAQRYEARLQTQAPFDAGAVSEP